MSYFNLRPDFITVLLQTSLQLFVIIPYCVGISYRAEHARDVNDVLFDLKLITLPPWSVYKVVFYFHKKATTSFICLRKFESEVLFYPIFYF